MQGNLRSQLVRRFCVTLSLFVIFLLWVGPPLSVRENLVPAAATIVIAAFIALFLSWPRRKWIRFAVFCGVAAVGVWKQLASPGPSTSPVIEAVIGVLPLAFMIGLILLVDMLVALVLRKIENRDRAAAA